MTKKRRKRSRKAVKAVTTASPPEDGTLSLPGDKHVLANLADALNATERAGLLVRLKHDAVITRYGYVLPLGELTAGERWQPRSLHLTEFSPPSDDGTGG